MPSETPLPSDPPASHLRYYVSTARGLATFDLSEHPEDSLWALIEFKDLVQVVQGAPDSSDTRNAVRE